MQEGVGVCGGGRWGGGCNFHFYCSKNWKYYIWSFHCAFTFSPQEKVPVKSGPVDHPAVTAERIVKAQHLSNTPKYYHRGNIFQKDRQEVWRVIEQRTNCRFSVWIFSIITTTVTVTETWLRYGENLSHSGKSHCYLHSFYTMCDMIDNIEYLYHYLWVFNICTHRGYCSNKWKCLTETNFHSGTIFRFVWMTTKLKVKMTSDESQ